MRSSKAADQGDSVTTEDQYIQRVIHDHPLATIYTTAEDGPLIDHLPVLALPARAAAEENARPVLQAHVARSNPVWRLWRQEQPLALVFHGPQRYISPNWYASRTADGRVAPTWNYLAVHAHVLPRVIDDGDWMRDFLQRLSHRLEADQAEPWNLPSAPDDYIAGLLRGVIGVEFQVMDWRLNAKMSQDQPPQNRATVIEQLASSGEPDDQRMVEWIKRLN